MTPTKRCSKCHTEKHLTEFYENQHTRSGYFSRCKTCVKTHQIAWSTTPDGKASIERFKKVNPTYFRDYGRAYDRSEEGKMARRKYRTSEKGKEVRKLYKIRRFGGPTEFQKNFRLLMDSYDTPEKLKAWKAATNAIRRGEIRRTPCVCGNPSSQAHHEDYNKPLDVIWLCPSCHQKLHYQKRLLDLDSY